MSIEIRTLYYNYEYEDQINIGTCIVTNILNTKNSNTETVEDKCYFIFKKELFEKSYKRPSSVILSF